MSGKLPSGSNNASEQDLSYNTSSLPYMKEGKPHRALPKDEELKATKED